jgi:hypothetical protein
MPRVARGSTRFTTPPARRGRDATRSAGAGGETSEHGLKAGLRTKGLHEGLDGDRPARRPRRRLGEEFFERQDRLDRATAKSMSTSQGEGGFRVAIVGSQLVHGRPGPSHDLVGGCATTLTPGRVRQAKQRPRVSRNVFQRTLEHGDGARLVAGGESREPQTAAGVHGELGGEQVAPSARQFTIERGVRLRDVPP